MSYKLNGQLAVLKNTVESIGYSKVFAQLCSRDDTPIYFLLYVIGLYNAEYSKINREFLTLEKVLRNNRV